MRGGLRIGCVIPALNEARAIGRVLAAVPGWVDAVVVADNGSDDGTGEVARASGAIVVTEPRRGYGQACLAALATLPAVDIVAFIDGDFSDHPEDIHMLVDPIVAGRADLVMASRTLGSVEPGALTPQQRFGNWLATGLVAAFWRKRFTDLGPFRAISVAALRTLDMRDTTFGWTVEMQIKAARAGFRAIEQPARYRRRIGDSKISGTLSGSVRAGAKILVLIWREALLPSQRSGR